MPLKRKLPKKVVELRDRSQEIKERLLVILRRWNRNLQSWPIILVRSVRTTLNPSASVMAAALAYFALLSIFPLIIFTISISSFWFPQGIEQQEIINQFEFMAPSLGQLIGKNIDEIVNSRGPVSTFALLGLLWTASTMFYMLNRTMSTIWNHDKEIAFWKRRGTSILLVLLVVGPLLFLASFVSSFIANFQHLVPKNFLEVYSLAGVLISILADIILFFGAYLILPRGNSTWRSNIPGAILAGLLWEAAKRVFVLFGARYLSSSNLVYGSVATIVVLMVWMYISFLILFFGCYINVYYHKHIQARLDLEREILLAQKATLQKT